MSVISPGEPVVVDARGHRCPVPTLRLAGALEGLKAGETVLLLCDDPLARVDVPHYAAERGHVVLSLVVQDDGIRAVVARGKRPGAAAPSARTGEDQLSGDGRGLQVEDLLR